MHTRDMNTTQRITKTAHRISLTATQESGELVLRNGAGVAYASATIVGGKFYGAWTADFMGHITSHSTVKGMLTALEAQA